MKLFRDCFMGEKKQKTKKSKICGVFFKIRGKECNNVVVSSQNSPAWE